MKSNQYVVPPALEEAVRVAEITERPLLLKGEPGTGKTLLAEAMAESRSRTLFRWHIKSISQARDGLYFYDALTRLNDSRFAESSEKVKDIENYIQPGPLGQAFDSDQPCIVLIDEIDKADSEFPNDLLLELDQMEFVITETGRRVRAKQRPLAIITSNNEKELPDAFLRRCIFHYIDFPDPQFMQIIVKKHFPDLETSLMDAALTMFYKLRNLNELRKKPSTSELIDWLRILIHQGLNLEDGRIPAPGSLIKNEEDMRLIKARL
ncbi:MAG: MoxR family ATPase [Spirochaetia bacterium]|nr:MoxR family ATPase [Spirochaetia bacterium]